MQQSPVMRLSIEEYLQGELESEIRHEFYDGMVYAMAGAGRRHNIITLNIATQLRQGARGTTCRSFMADMKLYLPAINRFYYPDIIVACETDDNQEFYIEKPCLIVEVLSPTTEGIDRREKLHAYQEIPSLKAYIMVSQDTQKAELYKRDGEIWQYILLDDKDDILPIPCLNLSIAMAEIYEDVF